MTKKICVGQSKQILIDCKLGKKIYTGVERKGKNIK